MTFYEKLVKLIDERGMTQRQFIKELGLNSSAIQNWRRQGSKPRPETMNMIADYLNVEKKSLEDDNMPIVPLTPEEIEFKSTKDNKARHQRVSCISGNFDVTEDMLKRLTIFTNSQMTFLINPSEKVFDPKVHQLPDRKIENIDFSTFYDILELSDSYASDDLSRNVLTQISRIVMYRVKTTLPNYAEMAKDDYYFWRDVMGIFYDKVKYLLFQPTANYEMNYGFNLTELLHIRRVSGISLMYLLSGAGEPFDSFAK